MRIAGFPEQIIRYHELSFSLTNQDQILKNLLKIIINLKK